jgi:hypothetical protein
MLRFRDTKERRASLPNQDLVLVINKAQQQANELLTQVEGEGRPQNNESSAGYLALVTLQPRLVRGIHHHLLLPSSGALLGQAARGRTPGPAAVLPFEDAERH